MTKSEGEKIHDIYECGTYSRSRHRVEQECSGHYVPTEAVRELILMTLRGLPLGDPKQGKICCPRP